MNGECNFKGEIRATVQQKIFVSEKFRQKRPSGSSSGIYFRQTDRSFWLRSFGSLAYRLSSHSWLFLIPHLSFWGKFSQEFNLVKKLLWRKRRNQIPDEDFVLYCICRSWVFDGNGLLGHRLIDSRWFEKNPPTESGWKRRSKKTPTYRYFARKWSWRNMWAFFFERRFQPLSVGGFFSNQRESISRCPKSPFPSKTQEKLSCSVNFEFRIECYFVRVTWNGCKLLV